MVATLRHFTEIGSFGGQLHHYSSPSLITTHADSIYVFLWVVTSDRNRTLGTATNLLNVPVSHYFIFERHLDLNKSYYCSLARNL